MKRIYIAGPFSADNILSIMANMRRGMKEGVTLIQEGFAPFIPWLDFQLGLLDNTLTIDDFYRYSIAWLEVSDAILVLPDSDNSYGTQNEIERAKELRIPIFHNKEDLIKYFGGK